MFQIVIIYHCTKPKSQIKTVNSLIYMNINIWTVPTSKANQTKSSQKKKKKNESRRKKVSLFCFLCYVVFRLSLLLLYLFYFLYTIFQTESMICCGMSKNHRTVKVRRPCFLIFFFCGGGEEKEWRDWKIRVYYLSYFFFFQG